MIDNLLYSHHLPAWHCIDIVRRNSVLVTCASERVKENPLQKVNKHISYHFSGWRQRTRSGMNYCPCIKAIWKKKIGTKSKNTILNKFIFFHSIISFYRFFIHLFIHSFIHSSAQPFWGNITIFSLIAISTIPGTERQAV